MKIFGTEASVFLNQLLALTMNVRAWLLAQIRIVPRAIAELDASGQAKRIRKSCVLIESAGGLEQLRMRALDDEGEINATATVGYNIPGHPPPFVKYVSGSEDAVFDPTLIVVDVEYFSINYADIAIRWGLYESALRYVGWPIVPGFDFTGKVAWAGNASGFSAGDEVFGFTLFGAYSSRLLVPSKQVRLLPRLNDTAVAAPSSSSLLDTTARNVASTLSDKAAMAGFSAVAATALHAVELARGSQGQRRSNTTGSSKNNNDNNVIITRNKGALIHSAAGGVGSMLLQICRLKGFKPIVAVVGSGHKVEYCRSLGADVVFDKSAPRYRRNPEFLWADARAFAPDGFAAIFDANGVETLAASYENIARCGKLVLYGFHTNVPKASSFLSPFHWIGMILKMASLPKFDPMSLVLESKAVLGFNLSFFADEDGLIDAYFDQLMEWLESGALKTPSVTVFDMAHIAEAHNLIQSGVSVGKLVIRCP